MAPIWPPINLSPEGTLLNNANLKVLGKSVGLCVNFKEKYGSTIVHQFYVVSVWKIKNLWKFQPRQTHISWEMNENSTLQII